jgi:hypothetical protein
MTPPYKFSYGLSSEAIASLTPLNPNIPSYFFKLIMYNKNEEMSKKYKIEGKCLIKLKK